METDYEWGDAEVTYPDWVGTAQLDQRKTAAGIEEVVGLDPEKWAVIGLDIGGGEHAHDLRVVAVERAIFPEGGDVYPRIAAEHGEIPVTEFMIHDRDPYEVLRAITHVLELRLRVRRTVGHTIRVKALGDVPEQPGDE